jgi:hypothetical protein
VVELVKVAAAPTDYDRFRRWIETQVGPGWRRWAAAGKEAELLGSLGVSWGAAAPEKVGGSDA